MRRRLWCCLRILLPYIRSNMPAACSAGIYLIFIVYGKSNLFSDLPYVFHNYDTNLLYHGTHLRAILQPSQEEKHKYACKNISERGQ